MDNDQIKYGAKEYYYFQRAVSANRRRQAKVLNCFLESDSRFKDGLSEKNFLVGK